MTHAAPPASSAAVRAVMQGNSRHESAPERTLRSRLHRLGLRFRIGVSIATDAGRVKPDIVFTRRKVVVFLDGCFWHGCPEHGRVPRANNDYWAAKLARNRARDERQTAALTRAGWRVVRMWEHTPPDEASERVLSVLRPAVAAGPAPAAAPPRSRG